MKARSSVFSLFFTALLFVTGIAFGQSSPCSDMRLGSVTYAPNSSKITSEIEKSLQILRDQMNANPSCKVIVLGGAGGSKITQQLSWDRVNAIIEYMSDVLNVSRQRFIFRYEGPSNGDIVTFAGPQDGDDGPSNVAPPHPDLRR